mgnify:CR=1 FL=1
MKEFLAGKFDIAVIGAGHAGIEAALAAARMGLETVIFTINLDAVGNMPCNPAIGGTGKGHLVRELDALGGEMARAADRACIQYRMLNRRKAQTISDDAIQLLNIRVPHAQVRAGGLSGGNQQKLLISRWVAIGPRILILDEPTRGVDVGAKSEIYRIMNDMARQGVAILMISSELPEVVGMSDRVYVMREGVIAGELQAGDISQESIMTLATGVTDSHLKAGQL